MPLNDIVNVVITRQTQTITEQGFGTPMIFGSSVRFTDLIRYYSSMDEVAVDFDSNDPEYIAAQDIFSQDISPDLIAIGRRQVDEVDIDIVTAMTAEDYILKVNGNDLVVSSTSATTYSVATLNADLVPNNRVAVSVNGSPVSVTTLIQWDGDFITGNLITPIINGVTLGPAILFVDQTTTLAAVAARILTGDGVASSTVTGTDQITVVFESPLASVVNTFTNTGGASRPTQTNTSFGFLYAGSSSATMQSIADAIALFPDIAASDVSGTNNRVLTVQGPPNVSASIDSFVVTLGASQATATITNPLQSVTRESIAGDIVAAVQALIGDASFPLTAVDNSDGTFTLSAKVPGVPFTLKTSTTIGSPNRAVARITQVTPSTDYTISLNNVNFTFRSPINVQTSDQIATALVDLINDVNVTVPVTATNLTNGVIELESDNLNNTFSISVTPDIMTFTKGMQILNLVPANTVTEDLDLINNASNLWYALIATDRLPANVLLIAAWVEARIKLFGTASDDPDIINVPAGTDVNSIAAKLGQLGYVRTFVLYHQDSDFDYPEAAWFGAVLPLEPGSETWKFKTLRGISYSNLTTTQSLNALGKKANTYEFTAGVGITANGTVAQGEYIDIIRGIDWLTARIQEFVFRVLVTNPKVPYTDVGIAAIQAEVLRVLQLGIANDFIAADPVPTCTVPLASSVPPADKAARILRNVKFQATLAGAIHAVVIRGTVSV